ncbi:MAG: ribonuclease H-like domain-containing protein [Eubacteriales bacterium]|nr:ribonuclease H-like domain-containing protein [Eubacteriales bacterium]
MDKLRMIDSGASKRETVPAPESAPLECYRRSERFPLSSFSDFRHLSVPVLREIYGIEFPKKVKAEDLLFLDTETTGLSGGAGTIAFEVGLGYVSGGHFITEQFLMRDYPEEPLMLSEIARFTGAFPILVTFNGKTFDAPLLENRFVMNRIAGKKLPECHADVLHAARRVWKLRLGRCTLQKLENAVLGVSREDDLPGEQVPETYFRYLKNHDFGPMERILEHNRQDVVSLAQLFFFLCQLYALPETASEPEDLISLAKSMQKRGSAQKAKKCYRLAANGDRKADAFAALAAQEKREGRAGSAVKLYSAMLALGEEPVLACVGLAKLYEHQYRDAEQALVYVRQALLLLSEPSLTATEAVQQQRNALQYRYARLRRKIANVPKP